MTWEQARLKADKAFEVYAAALEKLNKIAQAVNEEKSTQENLNKAEEENERAFNEYNAALQALGAVQQEAFAMVTQANEQEGMQGLAAGGEEEYDATAAQEGMQEVGAGLGEGELDIQDEVMRDVVPDASGAYVSVGGFNTAEELPEPTLSVGLIACFYH